MNYVSIEILREAMQTLEFMKNHHDLDTPPCMGPEGKGLQYCGKLSEYFVPDGTRVSIGGDIEATPLWFCREHLELALGEPPRNQPIFRRIENPDEIE